MMIRIVTCSTLLLILALCPTLTAAGEPSPSAAGPASGPLTFVQAVFDAGLVGASSTALSPDEQYLYVASSIDDAVSVLRREDASGRLAFVEAKRDGVGGASALAGASGIAMSPDGGHVYVASWQDSALTVFSRDAATGRLTYVETHQDGVGGIVSLNGAHAVAVSPDGKHVYVGSISDDAVSVFSRNPSTGRLTFVEAEGPASGLHATYSVAISPDGKHVYAANRDNDTVTVFARDATTGELVYRSSVQDGVAGVNGLDSAMAVTVSDDGANVYVAGQTDHAVAVFQRDATSGALTFVEAEFDGVAGVEGLAGPMAVAVSHNGSHVYVAGETDQAVAIFARGANGALTYAGMVQNAGGGVHEMQSPQGLTLDQDGRHLYVAAWSRGGVEVFARNASDGSLAIIQEQKSGDGLQGAVGLTVSPGGRCVYATGANDNAVVILGRDPATGALDYRIAVTLESVPGLKSAVGVAVSPDGGYVYVAGYDDDAVVAFSTLSCQWLDHVATYTNTAPIDGLDGARALAFSPDGSLLYVASSLDNALAIFDRDPDSGALTFRRAVFDGASGIIDGLGGAYSVAVSPNGADFYVAGYNDDAVAVFSWASGALMFRGMVKDGVGGVDGLDGASWVAVSPDGRHVYAAGRGDDAVAIFSRDPTYGDLTYRGLVKDGVGGVDGLDGARALAISPDGTQVYVASQLDDALAVFNRSSADGSLAFAAVYKDGAGGVDGLNTADGIAVSPDGNHIYVSGYDDNALAVFARNWVVYLPLTLR